MLIAQSIKLTFALIIDAGLVARARVVATASNVAHAIATYLVCDTVIVAIAYRLANAAVAPLVTQAICVAERT